MTRQPSSAAQLLEAAVCARFAEHHSPKPLVVGICGSQASGKSTACEHVAGVMAASGIRVAVLSIDDLYLSRAAREDLGRRMHPLLLTRGVPGTHDPLSGLRTIEALGTRGRVLLPRFDKARDDREPESRWNAVDAPVDVVLFEGWCVGAKPQDARQLEAPVNALEAQEDADGRWRRYVNDALSRSLRAIDPPHPGRNADTRRPGAAPGRKPARHLMNGAQAQLMPKMRCSADWKCRTSAASA